MLCVKAAASYRVKLIEDFHHVLLQLHADLFALERQTRHIKGEWKKKRKKQLRPLTESHPSEIPPTVRPPGHHSEGSAV